MILLKLITWPYVRRHKARTGLTLFGIVLGVAVFIGMRTANDSVLLAFQKTIDRIAGKAQLQVSTGEGGFPEDVLDIVQALPEVRVAVPVVEAAVDTGRKDEGNLLILATDMIGDRSLRDYDLDSGDDAIIDDPLVFLAQPDSLMVTREYADRTGLRIGSRVPMRTMDGDKQFTVRGIMKSGGLSKAFGGNVAVMDIYAAQKVFGRGRRFDRIDLALKEGVGIAQGRMAIEKALGAGFQVEPPASRGQQVESVLRVYSFTVNLNSAFALFIGMFIIYNSFAIAVTQRRSEIGILRALGASRAQIRNLFLMESALAGLVGSTGGLGLGMLMARGLAVYVSNLLSGVYGVAERASELSTDPTILLAGLVMGMATSTIAGFLPARDAARVDPIQALQKGKYQVLSAGENRTRRTVAMVCAAAAATSLFFSSVPAFFYAGFLLTLLTMLLLSPSWTLWLTRAMRPALKWLRPIEGALAADSLIEAPRRTSSTVAALMLSLAFVISLGGVIQASYNSIMDWTTTTLNPDLFVTPSPTLTDRSFQFPPGVGDTLRTIDGVDEIQSVRTQRILYDHAQVLLIAVEAHSLGRRVRRPVVEGPANMYELAGAGKGVILSEILARLHHFHAGDTMELASPTGLHRMPVIGIVVDWSDEGGAILMDRATYISWWRDDTVSIFRVYTKPGVAPMDVRQRIIDRFAGTRRFFVLTNAEVRAFIMKVTDQWNALAYALIAIAVLIAILGIVNTLTASIIDRRRELGVLRAVGGLRNQVRYTIWIEAQAIALVGLVLGGACGSVMLKYVLVMTERDIAGTALPYTFPVGIAAMLVPIMLVSAFVAALWPAESAVRGSLAEALEYE
ncbi:MAG: ABC transporter permease [Acidobacteria bacterium]|nr:ABC transporter permease [Acidobacteriota bacterium]